MCAQEFHIAKKAIPFAHPDTGAETQPEGAHSPTRTLLHMFAHTHSLNRRTRPGFARLILKHPYTSCGFVRLILKHPYTACGFELLLPFFLFPLLL